MASRTSTSSPANANRSLARSLCPAIRQLSLLAGSLSLILACGGGAVSYREVDQPKGYSQQYGAPKNPSFVLRSELDKDVLRLTIMKQAECDLIKTRLVERTLQKLEGTQVVNEEALGTVQAESKIVGSKACDEGYARDAQVSLRVGTATHRLGKTSPTGQLNVNLSGALQQSLYGQETPESAMVLIEWRSRGKVEYAEAGELSLAEVRKHQERVDTLLVQLRPILNTPVEQLQPEDITRSYELYEQLRILDAGDARISALQARFLELFYERKRLERSERFAKDLEALKQAKELFAGGNVVAPSYFQVLLSQQQAPSQTSLLWAREQVVVAARSGTLCKQPFTWAAGDAYSPTTQFALQFLRYAHGTAFGSEVSQVCQRAAGWGW